MSVNGITNSAATAYSYPVADQKNEKVEENKSTANEKESAAVYEPSKDAGKAQKYKPDADTVARLKAEVDMRKSQLMDLVQKMLSGQANAQGKADSIWNLLREGKLNPDAATRDQAIKDIGEDGYWGVSQTSGRILDFAKALTGGDPKKIDEMQRAFEKGYKMAEKTWGGKLPEISQKTFDAVINGFKKMKEEMGIS